MTAARPVRRRRSWRDDRGQVSLWTIFGAVIVLVLAGLVLDQGLVMADKVRLLDIAQAAARAGTQRLDMAAHRAAGVVRLDQPAAAAAARAFLTTRGKPGAVSTTSTTVTVTVTGTRRTQLLTLVGVTSIPIAATATASPTTR
ncbi:hypothetical protein Val02_62570 [Virgisporangium aliadipatigenens]|uniref:Uncharacterized protein n=1 Tax=Virgisporangium aliadipatigenens TaxID=741659 RepID=A0A8J3YT65_9ACTN|nr:pilus assembly protein TadG-related protein [Virgisporangium aliadipatigenens]GIJ49371.1 hypothetical protein Val02_62570 [Virgisporangium aliadipatigenens]